MPVARSLKIRGLVGNSNPQSACHDEYHLGLYPLVCCAQTVGSRGIPPLTISSKLSNLTNAGAFDGPVGGLDGRRLKRQSPHRAGVVDA